MKINKKNTVLKYGFLAVALILMIAVSVFLSGSSDRSSAAATTPDYTIDLTSPASGTGWTYSGTIIAFDTNANGHTYQIEQTTVGTLSRTMVFNSGVSTAVIFAGINIAGEINLNGAELALWISAGSTNTINGNILVPLGSSILIDSTNPGSSDGSLTVTSANSYAAGIGSSNCSTGNSTIKGGTITATGGFYGAGIGGGGLTTGGASDGGTIAIVGGTVNATGGRYGAGIGGGGGNGNGQSGGNGGVITIGGTAVVNAYGTGGAGIGGGGGYFTKNGTPGVITINGGTVTATGANGAGIGSSAPLNGNVNNGGTITINGGTVTATGSTGCAGIGGTLYGDIDAIIITGGNIIATSTSGGDGIGSGGYGTSTNVTISSAAKILAFSRPAYNDYYNAVPIRGAGTGSTGYYVNAIMEYGREFSGPVEVYADGGLTPILTIDIPAGCYGFAFQLPSDAAVSKTYKLVAVESGTKKNLVRLADESPEIYSVKSNTGYDAHDGWNGALPLKFEGYILTLEIVGNGTVNVTGNSPKYGPINETAHEGTNIISFAVDVTELKLTPTNGSDVFYQFYNSGMAHPVTYNPSPTYDVSGGNQNIYAYFIDPAESTTLDLEVVGPAVSQGKITVIVKGDPYSAFTVDKGTAYSGNFYRGDNVTLSISGTATDFLYWIASPEPAGFFLGSGAGQTIWMMEDYDLKAVFETAGPLITDPHYITAISDGKTILAPGGVSAVQNGGERTFIFIAKSGYYISSVTVDGTPLTQEQINLGTYTFVNVVKDHTIEVKSAQEAGGGSKDTNNDTNNDTNKDADDDTDKITDQDNGVTADTNDGNVAATGGSGILWWLLVLIILLIIAGTLIWLYLRRKKQHDVT
ncbi:hypothetical protein Mpt1_c02910 [Candidatus Methanoplasma termitum]|uniref:Bacterial repeat domain-containing protein n=1 Tax=Candidatus Methanoplasma termitum TaxID=1577791 RepID=A0A0A7LFC4_9ARCH|nr:hypothetical protein Mpt1_c02910 [Candidatus Methanoplasma termitum]